MKVKCNRCGKEFKENNWEYWPNQILMFGTARFICRECEAKRIRAMSNSKRCKEVETNNG